MIFADWLKAEMNRRNLLAKDLADLAQVSRANISLILNGKASPGFEFCKAISEAFDISLIYVLELAELIEKGGKRELAEDSQTVREITVLAKAMSEDKQKMLLSYAKFLGSE